MNGAQKQPGGVAAWNMRSKRLLVVCFIAAVYVATLCISWDLFRFLTPYAFGFLAAYVGFESWRPTGLAEKIADMTAGQGS